MQQNNQKSMPRWKCRTIPFSDVGRFAWSELKRFHNVQFVIDQLAAQYPDASTNNLRKQATQIRYCLIQAREYADAANAVSLATKPNLLYYSIMSLALAEILFKQDGLSSLDKAREKHRHHGLELVNNETTEKGLPATAAALRARPMQNKNVRVGTFELWHRTCRESSVVGFVQRPFPGGTIDGFELVMSANSDQLPPVPLQGISLLDALAMLAPLQAMFADFGLRTPVVRASVRKEFRNDASERLILSVHPGNEETVQNFFELIEVPGRHHENIQVDLQSNFGNLIVTQTQTNTASLDFPSSFPGGKNEVCFWAERVPLNEFGYFYIALFIAGNYARYFPDAWLKDIETATPLALAIEMLTDSAISKIPWLCLNELARTVHFVD